MDDLKAFFKEKGISTQQIADRTRYSVRYVRNLLNGSDDFNDRARFRFMMAFPEAKPFLVSGNNGKDIEQ